MGLHARWDYLLGTIDGGLTDEVTGRGLCTGLGAIYSRGLSMGF